MVPPTPPATAEGGGARCSSPVWLGEGGTEGGRSKEVERAGGEWSNGGRESTPALMSDEML
jgi:hypothetical protein